MRAHSQIALAAAAGLLAATVASAASHTTHRTSGTTHAFAGRHEMTGTVTNVDRTAGKIQIEAQGKKLDLRFPQSALAGIEKGDQVAVELAIREIAGAPAATHMRTPGATGGTRDYGNPEQAGDNPGNPGELPGEHSGGLTRQPR